MNPQVELGYTITFFGLLFKGLKVLNRLYFCRRRLDAASRCG